MGGDVERRKGNRSLSVLKPEAPQGVLTCSNPGKTSPSLVITVYMSGLKASVCCGPEMYALITFDIPISLSCRLLRAMQEVNELQ